MSSILLAYSFFIPFAVVLCLFLFPRGQRRDSIRIVLTAVTAYGLFAGVCYQVNMDNPVLPPSDQWSFWRICDLLSHYPSLSSAFQACVVDKSFGGNEGFKFLLGMVGYWANNYADGNSWLLQMIVVSFFASLIPLFLYKLLGFYVSDDHGKKFTYLYLFFSLAISYSGFLLRDVHIALMYLVLLVLIHGTVTLTKLVLQFLLIVLIYTFRPESALAAFPLVLLYVFLPHGNRHGSYQAKFICVFVVGSLILLGGAILDFVTEAGQTIEDYEELRKNFLGDGFAAYLYTLPHGIREIAVVLYSQVFPFPCWAYFANARTVTDGLYVLFSTCIQPVFWFGIMYTLVGLLIQKTRDKLPLFLKLLLVYFVLFLFLNASNINPRRLFSVYPIAYVAWAFLWTKVRKPIKSRLLWSAFTVYLILSVSYLALKVM